MVFQDNVLKEYLKNVWFITGTPCGGKTTVTRALAKKHGLMVYDIMGIAANGFGMLSFLILIRYLFSAAAAFLGAKLGIKLMRLLAGGRGFSVFGVYCWGLALFTFILNLIA